jgi:hypothetical protein
VLSAAPRTRPTQIMQQIGVPEAAEVAAELDALLDPF